MGVGATFLPKLSKKRLVRDDGRCFDTHAQRGSRAWQQPHPLHEFPLLLLVVGGVAVDGKRLKMKRIGGGVSSGVASPPAATPTPTTTPTTTSLTRLTTSLTSPTAPSLRRASGPQLPLVGHVPQRTPRHLERQQRAQRAQREMERTEILDCVEYRPGRACIVLPTARPSWTTRRCGWRRNRHPATGAGGRGERGALCRRAWSQQCPTGHCCRSPRRTNSWAT